MKKMICFVIVLFSLILIESPTKAQPRLEYGNPLQAYTSDTGLNIISYSKNWDTQQKLEEIYNELLNNFHSDELNYLAEIYIYPDSPDGTNGAYYESATIDNSGKYEYKNDAYIEIFNGNERHDVSQMAWELAHEYGHHFTYYYLITNENKYTNQWNNTEYAKIRQLDKYPQVSYINDNEQYYSHEWDISEILANDYLELFGSKLAKESVDYKDIVECVDEKIDRHYESGSYNLSPQENLHLPLAADVDGLYNYWLNLTGYTGNPTKLAARPIPYMKDKEVVYFGENTKYALSWNEVPDNNIYEYTAIMYPTGTPYFPIPIKTLTTGEEMIAHIGSAVKYENGELGGILECMSGEYEIRLFIKDSNGFIFSSETLYYDFTTGLSRYDENIERHVEDIANISKHVPIPFEPLYTFSESKTYIENTLPVLNITNSKDFLQQNYFNNKKYIVYSDRVERIPISLMNDLTKDKFSNHSINFSANVNIEGGQYPSFCLLNILLTMDISNE